MKNRIAMYELKTRKGRFLLMFKFLYALCIVIFVGCKGEQSRLSVKEALKVESEVRQLFANYFEAIRKEGMTAEFHYLDRSSDFFWVPPGYHHPISYDSVAAVLTLSAPGFVSVENSFDTLRIIPLTTSLATYTAKLKSVMKDTSGNISSLQLIETGVVIKRSDGWKLLGGQTSVLN
ncbi:MAG TPA: nuclear transport factor 2 family protein [Chryseolinea sp.]|nr:nuclear transport factor 2 family protein [Chryseolinea sp.]